MKIAQHYPPLITGSVDKVSERKALLGLTLEEFNPLIMR
jgi:hypothetical protein